LALNLDFLFSDVLEIHPALSSGVCKGTRGVIWLRWITIRRL